MKWLITVDGYVCSSCWNTLFWRTDVLTKHGALQQWNFFGYAMIMYIEYCRHTSINSSVFIILVWCPCCRWLRLCPDVLRGYGCICVHPCSKVIGFFAISNDGVHFQCIELKFSCCMIKFYALIVKKYRECMLYRHACVNIPIYFVLKNALPKR